MRFKRNLNLIWIIALNMICFKGELIMSTMHINHATFQNLAHTLAGIDYTGNGCIYQFVGHSLVNKGNQWGFSGTNPNNKEYNGLHRLMGYLAAMNHRACKSRYSDSDNSFSKYPCYETKLVRLNIYQVLKSLNAIRYNIDIECEILNKLIECIQDALIGNLTEYNSAVWG